MCVRLSRDGYVVVATDKDAEAVGEVADELQKGGASCVGRHLDVTDGRECMNTVAALVKEIGSIYGLINNAGVGRATPFLEMTEEAWDWVQAVNIRGAFVMCRAVAPYLVEQGRGRSSTSRRSQARTASQIGCITQLQSTRSLD